MEFYRLTDEKIEQFGWCFTDLNNVDNKTEPDWKSCEDDEKGTEGYKSLTGGHK